MSKQTSLGSANVGLIIGVIAVIVIIFVIFNQTTSKDAVTSDLNDRTVAEETDTSPIEEITENSEGEMVTETPENTTGSEDMEDPATESTATAGTYADYDEAMLAKAESGKVLLFFHASWCPSCRSLEKNVENNLSNIPEDVTILVVNYDKETDLKKKYGVTRQHTLVQVDANGDKIKTLNGLTNTLDQVLAQI